jgi:hypothetical protein
MPPEPPTPSLTQPHAVRVVRIVCAAAALAGLWLFASHASRYFFLFDDFPLNGQASRWPLREILGTPLFGFFRPGFFLWLRGAHGLFGWHTPQGYATLAVAVHVVNALLVGRLARAILGAGAPAWLAATLFLLSPWSAEAVFWVSGGFDLLATCGALVAVLTGLACCRPGTRPATATAWLVACLAGTTVALFTKESTVILAGFFALLVAARAGAPTPSLVSWRRAAGVIAAIVALTLLYLGVRRVAVTSLAGGAYGNWFALVSQADVLANVASFGRAALVWPAPHDAQMRTVGLLASIGPLSALSLGLLVVAGVALRLRVGLTLATAAAVCVLPVVWIGLAPGSSGGGRVIYLAGVPFVVLCALGLQRLLAQRSEWPGAAAAAATGAILAAGLLSLHGQAAIWGQACRLARASVEAFRPFVGQTDPIHIDNLPFWFEEGPYVMKSYGFAYYYFPANVPPTTGTALSLLSVGDRVTVTTRGPEPGAGTPPPGAGPVALEIELR